MNYQEGKYTYSLTYIDLEVENSLFIGSREHALVSKHNKYYSIELELSGTYKIYSITKRDKIFCENLGLILLPEKNTLNEEVLKKKVVQLDIEDYISAIPVFSEIKSSHHVMVSSKKENINETIMIGGLDLNHWVYKTSDPKVTTFGGVGNSYCFVSKIMNYESPVFIIRNYFPEIKKIQNSLFNKLLRYIQANYLGPLGYSRKGVHFTVDINSEMPNFYFQRNKFGTATYTVNIINQKEVTSWVRLSKLSPYRGDFGWSYIREDIMKFDGDEVGNLLVKEIQSKL